MTRKWQYPILFSFLLKKKLFLAPRTEAECNAHGYGCIETFVDEAFINGFMMTFKDKANCLAAGGKYVNVLTWMPVSCFITLKICVISGGIDQTLTFAKFRSKFIDPTEIILILYTSEPN